MLFSLRKLTAVLLSTSLLATASAQYLFHGTSVIVTPNDLQPRNATVESASFYCFATPSGYVTFGWWTGGDPADLKLKPICPNPEPEQLDWFEYSTGKCDKNGICRLKAYNYDFAKPEHPAFSEDYVIMPFQLGERDDELMFLSYFDREHGKMAVGVRRLVEGKECRQAYRTLSNIVKEQKLPVEFDLEDPCGETTIGSLVQEAEQAIARSHSRAWSLAGLQQMLEL